MGDKYFNATCIRTIILHIIRRVYLINIQREKRQLCLHYLFECHSHLIRFLSSSSNGTTKESIKRNQMIVCNKQRSAIQIHAYYTFSIKEFNIFVNVTTSAWISCFSIGENCFFELESEIKNTKDDKSYVTLFLMSWRPGSAVVPLRTIWSLCSNSSLNDYCDNTSGPDF